MAIIRRNVDCPQEIAENRRLAYQDPLTGLENRRAFTRALKRELAVAFRDKETGLAVFYIDLDEFKKVNDLGGHDAGDDMLLRVAACLRLTLGEFGTVARIGGDEFAGMVPAANEGGRALDVAEKILDGFDRISLESQATGCSRSAARLALPLSTWRPVAARSGCECLLLGLADQACLRGKRFGGSSVQIHAVESDRMPDTGLRTG